MRVLLAGLTLSLTVSGSCVGNLAPFVFRDLHDGDLKVVTANVFDFVIQPYDNDEDWLVRGTFDYDCVANVDFNVPGKPNPPPVNLTMSLWVMGNNGAHHDTYQRLGLEFTDPSETLAPATEPLNLWVLDHWPKAASPPEFPQLTAASTTCIDTPRFGSSIFCDVHDGDKKAIKISKSKLHITPYSSGESWTVDAELDSDCDATVDFNVPGKPNPPPVALEAQVWGMVSILERPDKQAVLFMDPTGTVAPAGAVINAWVPGNEVAQTV